MVGRKTIGCLICLAVSAALVMTVSSCTRSCVAELNKPKPVYAKTDIYLRAESIRDWMSNNGYEKVSIASSKDDAVANVVGYFTRDGLKYEMTVLDNTPEAGDLETITIVPISSLGDMNGGILYFANAAPTAKTAYQNVTTGTVASHQ